MNVSRFMNLAAIFSLDLESQCNKTVNFTHFPLQSSGQVILRGSKIKGNVGTICRGWTVPLSYNQRKLWVYCKMLVSKLCPIKWFISGKVQNTPRPPGPLTEARFLLFELEVKLSNGSLQIRNDGKCPSLWGVRRFPSFLKLISRINLISIIGDGNF